MEAEPSSIMDDFGEYTTMSRKTARLPCPPRKKGPLRWPKLAQAPSTRAARPSRRRGGLSGSSASSSASSWASSSTLRRDPAAECRPRRRRCRRRRLSPPPPPIPHPPAAAAALNPQSWFVFFNPVAWAVLFTFGNIVSMSSTMFLCGPKKQFKNMTDKTRLARAKPAPLPPPRRGPRAQSPRGAERCRCCVQGTSIVYVTFMILTLVMCASPTAPLFAAAAPAEGNFRSHRVFHLAAAPHPRRTRRAARRGAQGAENKVDDWDHHLVRLFPFPFSRQSACARSVHAVRGAAAASCRRGAWGLTSPIAPLAAASCNGVHSFGTASPTSRSRAPQSPK